MPRPPRSAGEAASRLRSLMRRYQARRAAIVSNPTDAREALRKACVEVRRTIDAVVARRARTHGSWGASTQSLLWLADFGADCLRKREMPVGSRRVSTEARVWEQVAGPIDRMTRGKPAPGDLDLTVRVVARRIRRAPSGVSRTVAWRLYRRCQDAFRRWSRQTRPEAQAFDRLPKVPPWEW